MLKVAVSVPVSGIETSDIIDIAIMCILIAG